MDDVSFSRGTSGGTILAMRKILKSEANGKGVDTR
jgi:hypothetical protein